MGRPRRGRRRAPSARLRASLPRRPARHDPPCPAADRRAPPGPDRNARARRRRGARAGPASGGSGMHRPGLELAQVRRGRAAARLLGGRASPPRLHDPARQALYAGRTVSGIASRPINAPTAGSEGQYFIAELRRHRRLAGYRPPPPRRLAMLYGWRAAGRAQRRRSGLESGHDLAIGAHRRECVAAGAPNGYGGTWTCP